MAIVQAEAGDIEWISELEASEYTSEDAVPRETLLSWFHRNPGGFSLIENAHGVRIGHIDVLPLDLASARPFFEGQVLEREIRPEWIFTPAEKGQIRDLYIESIIITGATAVSGARALRAVFREFGSLAARLCDPVQLRDIYAIEATAPGQNLLTRIGFERCGEAGARKDNHQMFRLPAATLRANVQKWIC